MRNKIKVIDSIRAGAGKFSKKDVHLHSGVSWGAMYKIVENLLASKVISQGSEKPVGRGRPNIPLQLDPDAAYFAGLDIGSSYTKIVFCDLDFKLRHQEKAATPTYSGETAFFDWLKNLYRNALANSELNAAKISGLCIAVSGTVDSEAGVIVSGANWGLAPGAKLDVTCLSERLSCPVCVYSTQVAAVQAEYLFGEKAGCGNLVSIGLGVGIGSGAIANHVLLISHPKRPVGYIGHLLIPDNDRDCVCGWHGCLEAFSGGNSLTKIARSKLDGVNSAKDIDTLAASGNKTAKKIMDTAAKYNAVGIAGMIQLYSPEAVIFAGGQSRLDGYLFKQTVTELQKLLPADRRDCVIGITALGEYQAALGAARLAYENFF